MPIQACNTIKNPGSITPMSEAFYSIGKDVQDLRNRIDRLESPESSTNLRRNSRRLEALSSPIIDFGVSSDQLTFLGKESQPTAPSILAVTYTAPYVQHNTWDSGSSGDTYINGAVSGNKDTGILESILTRPPFDADDDERGSRWLESYFWVGYQNPYSTGRLKIVADFFIEEGYINGRLYDELFESNIDFISTQRVRIDQFKTVGGGNELVRFGESATTHQEFTFKIGPKEKAYTVPISENKGSRGLQAVCVSANVLQPTEIAWSAIGLWTGTSFFADDYEVSCINKLRLRLDKVTAEIV